MAGLRPAKALDPGCRLLCLALVSSAVFFLGAPCAALAALGLMALVALEGVPPRRILKEAGYILLLSLFALVLECVGWNGGPVFYAEYLPGIAAYAARLLSAFMAGRLFYTVTDSSELRIAALKAGRLLPRKLRGDAALAMILVIGFVPLIRDEWKSSLDAAKARGLQLRSAKGFSLRANVDFLAAFLRRLMLDSLSLPEALASRGWEGGDRSPRLALDPWRGRDWLAAALSLAVLSLAIVFRERGPSGSLWR